jgi:hypothetical protein
MRDLRVSLTLSFACTQFKCCFFLALFNFLHISHLTQSQRCAQNNEVLFFWFTNLSNTFMNFKRNIKKKLNSTWKISRDLCEKRLICIFFGALRVNFIFQSQWIVYEFTHKMKWNVVKKNCALCVSDFSWIFGFKMSIKSKAKGLY